LRIDSHHSFTERYPLEHLAFILTRNRFGGSVLVGPAAWPVPDNAIVKAAIPPLDLHRLDDYLLHPKFAGLHHCFDSVMPDSLGELERRGIPLDAEADLPMIRRIADRYPALRIAIAGPPRGDWAHDLELVAETPNVYCKLTGLTRLEPSPRPFVQHALAVFGPRRLMFGSGWPAYLPEFTWKASLAAFTQAIGAQPIEVREELLGGTATRFYKLT
jgi:L-fuconolactonase